MKEFARKFRSLFTLLFTMLAASSYVFFIFLPGMRSIAEVDGQVSKLRSYIQVSSPLMLEIEDIEGKMGRIRQAQEEWQQSAGGVTRSSIYGNVSRLAETNQLKMVRFTPKPPASMSLLEPLGISLTYTGKFNGIANFMAELEAMPQVVWIDQASIQRQNGGDVQLALELRIFVDKTDTSS